MVRSRLYQCRFSQSNIQLSAFFEFYKFLALLHRSKLQIWTRISSTLAGFSKCLLKLLSNILMKNWRRWLNCWGLSGVTVRKSSRSRQTLKNHKMNVWLQKSASIQLLERTVWSSASGAREPVISLILDGADVGELQSPALRAFRWKLTWPAPKWAWFCNSFRNILWLIQSMLRPLEEHQL